LVPRKYVLIWLLTADLLAKMFCLRNFFEPDLDIGISFSSFSSYNNWNSWSSKYRYQSWKCLPWTTLCPFLRPKPSPCCGQFSDVYGNPIWTIFPSFVENKTNIFSYCNLQGIGTSVHRTPGLKHYNLQWSSKYVHLKSFYSFLFNILYNNQYRICTSNCIPQLKRPLALAFTSKMSFTHWRFHLWSQR